MRYFLELSYKGTQYSGFQVQQNAHTVQAAVEKVMAVLLKEQVVLTGSSRTDAGVHALQNYFHFDVDGSGGQLKKLGLDQLQYKMNAILPHDIAIRRIVEMNADAHCRFDAVARTYKYYISRVKNPFWQDRSFYFPYRLELEKMEEAASMIMEFDDFTSFSKRNTQAKTALCKVMESRWTERSGLLVYNVRANRFLRGMVRALTATMLKVGRGKMTLEELREVIEAKDCTRASFAVPGSGLFLVEIAYPDGYFDKK